MDQFEEIYDKYYRKIYLFLLKLSGNQSLAEELTQETLYKAFLHINQYEGRSSVYTWLCKIAKNSWLAEMNKRKLFVELEETDSGVNFEEDILERQMYDLMRREIMFLPEPYVSVCMLRIYAELPYAAIAAEFGKSESWAKVTYFRGKTMLAERMEKYR
ncbi:MAG: sigma-70 family RNA polymerase sigma factor [Lachnospiraceae bacterium]|nr:sigma-70 family RNA polymerase sigma factor [Lachnospiraceae bacterium]